VQYIDLTALSSSSSSASSSASLAADDADEEEDDKAVESILLLLHIVPGIHAHAIKVPTEIAHFFHKDISVINKV
jgi:hypothetical protein